MNCIVPVAVIALAAMLQQGTETTATAIAVASSGDPHAITPVLPSNVRLSSFEPEFGEFPAAIEWLRGKGVEEDPVVVPHVPIALQYDSNRTSSSSSSSTQSKYYDGVIERAVLVHRSYRRSQADDGRACETEHERLPAGEHTFNHTEFPGYGNDGRTSSGLPTLSILRMVDKPHTLVQRIQKSSLCYMHAPAVVQYYAVWHTALKAGKAASAHGMLDMAWFMANRFNGMQLASHVFRGDGGSSVDLLRAILLPNSELRTLTVAEAMEGLLRYGPALVSEFRAHQDFFDVGTHVHVTPPSPTSGDKYVGLHAMVLVGARVDASGRRFFLLQNWWAGKQFVEVSQAYLEAANAKLHFVVTPQSGTVHELRQHAPSVHYVTTEPAVEQAERVPLER